MASESGVFDCNILVHRNIKTSRVAPEVEQ